MIIEALLIIVHCVLPGVQDSVGKDPRIAMKREMGFKVLSVSDFSECYVSDEALSNQINDSLNLFRLCRTGLVLDLYAYARQARGER